MGLEVLDPRRPLQFQSYASGGALRKDSARPPLVQALATVLRLISREEITEHVFGCIMYSEFRIFE